MKTNRTLRTLKNKLLITCASLLLLHAGVSCMGKISYEKLMEKQLAEIFPPSFLSNYRCIVLIPNSGCSGCVQEAEDYFLQHQNNKDVLFIFTNFPSQKTLTIKLGKDSLTQSNVWLDNDNSFYYPEYVESIYPCVIFLKEGVIDYLANLDELLIDKQIDIESSVH